MNEVKLKTDLAKDGFVLTAAILLSFASSGPREFKTECSSEGRKVARSEILWESPRDLLFSGNLLVYSDLIFISEPGQGIHVYDNFDPTSPKAMGFLNIPGNRELTADNGVLYASAIDTLVIIEPSRLPSKDTVKVKHELLGSCQKIQQFN